MSADKANAQCAGSQQSDCKNQVEDVMALDMLLQALPRQPQLESLHVQLTPANNMVFAELDTSPEGHTLRMFEQLLKDLVDLICRSLWLRYFFSIVSSCLAHGPL